MCTLGLTRAARAWSAWARPISPPSTATAALLDMFWGLNGSTFSPRATSARASPATISDLPTSEPVPWNMSARAGIGQNSMPSCAFTPAAKWCFTKVISVTRSAASISCGLALRPVTTT